MSPHGPTKWPADGATAPVAGTNDELARAAALEENSLCEAVVREFQAWLEQQGVPRVVLMVCNEAADRIALRRHLMRSKHEGPDVRAR